MARTDGAAEVEHGPPGWSVSAVGLALLGAVGWHLAATHVGVMAAETDPVRFTLELVEAALLVVPPVALVYGGHSLSTRDRERESCRLVLRWVLVGIVSVVGVIAAVKLHRVLLGYPIYPSLAEMELLTGAGVGGLLGGTVGWHRARSGRQARQLERQRDAFLFLNRLLRHHVLNSVQVIDGYAERLSQRLDADARELCDPIRRRSRTVTALVENVRLVSRTFTDTPPVEVTDLTALVRAELETARHVHDGADITADLTEAAHVYANDLLAVAVENLLDNAVQHNDAETPHVHVTVDGDDEVGRVRVADDGPGIPAEVRARLAEPGETGDRGLGLYLVDRVVTQQGGRMRIDDHTPHGTVVTLELPAATERGGEDVKQPERTRPARTRLRGHL